VPFAFLRLILADHLKERAHILWGLAGLESRDNERLHHTRDQGAFKRPDCSPRFDIIGRARPPAPEFSSSRLWISPACSSSRTFCSRSGGLIWFRRSLTSCAISRRSFWIARCPLDIGILLRLFSSHRVAALEALRESCPFRVPAPHPRGPSQRACAHPLGSCRPGVPRQRAPAPHAGSGSFQTA